VQLRREDLWLRVRAARPWGDPVGLLRRNQAREGTARLVLARRSPGGGLGVELVADLSLHRKDFRHAGPEWHRTLGALGWSVRGRILLEAPGGPLETRVQEGPAGVSLAAEVLDLGALEDGCRRAIACYALLHAEGLRLVRPVLGDGGGLGFEVRLAVTASVDDIDRAMNALAAGVRQGIREIRGLRDPDLAARYLHHLNQETASCATKEPAFSCST
jgi:hypothetical protein